MNTDSNFIIGHDHIICEDYALAEVKANLAYAIVCDGCSASKNVDIGARALVMAARETLLQLTPNVPIDGDRFGSECILNANKIYNIFPHLHKQALDATLLVAWVRENELTVFMYGDGVFVHRYKDEEGTEQFNAVHINLSSGAPDYLSYQLDDNRIQSYRQLEENVKIVTTVDVIGTMREEHVPLKAIVMTADVQEGDIISLMSDGIGSFRNSSGESIDWVDMIPDFTGFKSTNGEFVHRRMNALNRRCKKELLTHADDLSIASIVV